MRDGLNELGYVMQWRYYAANENTVEKVPYILGSINSHVQMHVQLPPPRYPLPSCRKYTNVVLFRW